jgi:hypothetical protein
MDRTAAEILEQARKLPPSEINWLIGELLQEGDADAGNGSICSWEEVQAPLRARLGK